MKHFGLLLIVLLLGGCSGSVLHAMTTREPIIVSEPGAVPIRAQAWSEEACQDVIRQEAERRQLTVTIRPEEGPKGAWPLLTGGFSGPWMSSERPFHCIGEAVR